MNVRKVVYQFEELLWVWENATKRANTLGRESEKICNRLNGTHTNIMPTEEDSDMEIKSAKFFARLNFYESLGFSAPVVVFDPKKDENQYDMYPTDYVKDGESALWYLASDGVQSALYHATKHTEDIGLDGDACIHVEDARNLGKKYIGKI